MGTGERLDPALIERAPISREDGQLEVFGIGLREALGRSQIVIGENVLDKELRKIEGKVDEREAILRKGFVYLSSKMAG